MINLVIFDLDGTLLDTLADLANSTNYALNQCGFPLHSTPDYKEFVGNGINKLFERALPEGEKTEANILRIREKFLPHYGKNNNRYSKPYPGIPELLAALSSKGIMLAVASNKYQQATDKLVKYFFPEVSFIAVLGQREGIPAKPDPTIVNDILSVAGVKKEEALYIGDSGVDMQTIKNSNVCGVGVTWGFRPRQELEKYNPDYIIDKAEEVLGIIEVL